MTDHPDRDTSGPTKGAMSAAERQRRYYHRKKAKKLSKRLNFTKEYLDQLVRDGRIRAEELGDPEKLAECIEEDYYCQKHGTFRPGALVATGTTTIS